MAEDNKIFKRLKRLFSTGAVVTNIGAGRLKVVDTSMGQAFLRKSHRDRFNRIYMASGAAYNRDAIPAYNAIRYSLYRDYDAMDHDSIIYSALDIYADESTTKNEFGDVLKINSQNQEIKAILHNLFYDVLNIEFVLWPWIRNLTKYGDFFIALDIDEKNGIMNVHPISSYYVTREEGFDKDHPGLVRFVIENPLASGKQAVLQNYQIAHFRLLSDTNFLPYGKSMLEGSRRSWKQVNLMEDAMLIHRIMRAPEKRIFKIDVGNIKPEEVDAYMDKVIQKIKKIPFVDPRTGDYNLKYNMQNIIEDFFLPVRGGDSGTSIDTLGGLEYNAIEDVEYLRDKMMAGLKIPKAFIGYAENVSGKATLAAEDIRFARTIERIQKIVVSELTKMAIIHLYVQGYKDADLVDFSLELTNPSTIYEQEKIALWSEKIRLASDIKENKMLSDSWSYENIYKLSEEEWKTQRLKLIEDVKYRHRLESIEVEGVDPAKEKKSENGEKKTASFSGEDKGGRPKENQKKLGTDKHALGRDPLGNKENSSAGKRTDAEKSIKQPFKKSSPLAAGLTKFIDNNFGEQQILTEDWLNKNVDASDIITSSGSKSMLDETNIIEADHFEYIGGKLRKILDNI